MKLLSANEAHNTAIFVIQDGEVIETTLFDHVAESAKETTTPEGVGTVLFIREIEGLLYQKIGTEETISKDEYEELEASEQDDYKHLGTSVMGWQLREWNGSRSFSTSEIFDKESDAKDEWYTRTYAFDFQQDDQRDTRYWDSREDAEKELI